MCNICIKMLNKLRLYAKKNNNSVVLRNRNINICDALLYKFLYSQKNKTQENITSIINMHNGNNYNRTSYVRKEEKININIYKNMYDIVCSYESKFFPKYSKNIIAVDGTVTNINNKLSKLGYKLNKNDESISPLVLGVFNVTYNFPITLELVKHKNERKAFIDFINQKYDIKNTIYVFDRGFFSYPVVDTLNSKGLKFIFRIKKNSNLINKSNNDHINYIEYNNRSYKIRVIKYIINNKAYYLGTNIFNTDYTINIFKDIYHSRWTIEEYFKLIKSTMKMNKFDEKYESSIKKSIYCQLIITKISAFFKQCYKKQKSLNNNQKINENNLIKGIYDNLLIYMFYKVIKNKHLLRFKKTYIIIHMSIIGRKFKRACITPFCKWYTKQHFKKYVEADTEFIDK